MTAFKTLACCLVSGWLMAMTIGCSHSTTNHQGNGDGGGTIDAYIPPPCTGGVDSDGDRYGDGCPAGPDCNDENPNIHPDASEVCNGVDDNCNGSTDEGVLNACGNCNPLCATFEMGADPFPLGDEDPNVESSGVGLDPNGDLVLDRSSVDFNFMWIANTEDANHRGTVSKIDTTNLREVGRYFTVTCFGNPTYEQGLCLDVAGNQIQLSANNPSRTAVDYNFDVWVANRAFGGQPSATKIANSILDCQDRNGNGIVDTSQDHDGNGVIDIDCNGDGQPDDLTTVCTGTNPPEFLGLDDECVLFTTNYAGTNELGRSICLDAGDSYSGGAGNAWVGTYQRSGNNRFFKLNGRTGQITETVDLNAGVSPYGCTVDFQGILWTVGGYYAAGPMTFFDTTHPTFVGPVITEPFTSANHFYGIAVDSDDNIWVGGWDTRDVFRYRPNRTDFSTLSQGTWTRIRSSEQGSITETRGIAPDLRGWVWVASNGGHVFRVPQSLPDGDHTWAAASAAGAMFVNAAMGTSMVGAGIDFEGHVWGISYDRSAATRVDLDVLGNPVDLANNVFEVPVGANPYTYSDFTGYGLANFTRPRGTYAVLIPGCDNNRNTTWIRVEWSSTEPPDTFVRVRVRSGDASDSLGPYYGYWDSSPADLRLPPPDGNEALSPNPAAFLKLEFELSTNARETSPVLHDFSVIWECENTGPG